MTVWASWTNVALGVWLVVAAFTFPHSSGAAIIENIVAGSFVAVFALWAARAYKPVMSLIASWTVALVGMWVLTAPFVLGYERETASVANDVIVGIAIFTIGVMNVWMRSRLLTR